MGIGTPRKNPKKDTTIPYNYLTTRLFFGRIIDLSISFVGLRYLCVHQADATTTPAK